MFSKKSLQVNKYLLIILVIVAIAGIYGSIHYYDKYQALTIDPNVEAKKATDELVSTLGKLLELPQGETPTVVTISDKTQLANQPFFKDAENGDILFAFTASMKAILYRPSTNKIINMAPITTDQPPSVASSPKQQPVVTATTTKR